MTYIKYYEKGEELYANGNYLEALKLFEKSLSLNETNDCLNYIGCCYLKLGNSDSAINIFEKLITICPDWERPVFNLGRVFLKLENFKSALECFERAVNINPENEDAYYYLGLYYFEIGDYEKAKVFYEKSICLNNKQSETHLNLGMSYLKLKNYDEALDEFDKAYKYDNDCLDAIYNKGIALISMSRYNEALDNLLIVLNSNPNDIEAMMDIAHCYYKISDLVNANVWISKVLAIKPQHNLANKLLKRLASLMT